MAAIFDNSENGFGKKSFSVCERPQSHDTEGKIKHPSGAFRCDVQAFLQAHLHLHIASTHCRKLRNSLYILRSLAPPVQNCDPHLEPATYLALIAFS